MVPVSEHLDTVGPITRNVKDAAIILEAIAGADPDDKFTADIPKGQTPRYVDACKLSALKGARIGNMMRWQNEDLEAPIVAAFEEAVERMREAGAVIVDDVEYSALQELRKSMDANVVMDLDLNTNLPAYLSGLNRNPNKINTLSELREFTRKDRREDYPAHDTASWDSIIEGGINNKDPSFQIAYDNIRRLGGEGGVVGALDRNRLDAIISPSYFGYYVAGLAGTPVITVPLGALPPDFKEETTPKGQIYRGPNIP